MKLFDVTIPDSEEQAFKERTIEIVQSLKTKESTINEARHLSDEIVKLIVSMSSGKVTFEDFVTALYNLNLPYYNIVVQSGLLAKDGQK